MGSFQGHTKNGTAHQFNVISVSFARLKDKSIYLFSRQHTLTESTGYMTQCSATPAAAPAAATI